MKIIVTGSLGHISKPLTEELIVKGHHVIVISSKEEKRKEIEALGATTAIGSLEDTGFLADTFTSADAVYTMVPPNNYFDQNLDLRGYYRRIGHSYADAIGKSGIKQIVNLSSIGAHLTQGSGILIGAHDVEHILNALPPEVGITHIRPTSFYYNLYGYLDMIRNTGIIAANYGADKKVPWVAPADIAAVVAEEIEKPDYRREFRYVVSEELAGDQVAAILGKAIGMPELQWKLISDEETLLGLEDIGMQPQIAAGLVEMYAGFQSGFLAEDYYRNKPSVIGKVKMADFVKEFAKVYSQK